MARQRRLLYRPPAAIERAQQRRVRSACLHAHEHVPYYRETFDRLGLRPESFRSAADLTRLPIIQRDQVQRDPEYFTSRAQPIDNYVRLRTGGTSGRPLSVFYDPFALFKGAAHYRRFLQALRAATGRHPRMRGAVIGGPESVTAKIESELGSRSPIPARARAPMAHLSLMDSPARNVELLQEFRPDVLGSYGSYLEALFIDVRESGVAFDPPRAVVYGGDGMSDRVRRLLAEEMGIPVFSVYGAVEAFHIGFECERHTGIHLNHDLFPLRIVDADGRDCPPGQSGEVVLSNLVNRGTMLLNYRLGDRATMLDGRCACGRTLPLLSFVEGRVDDWLEGPSGDRRHPQTVRTLFTDEEEVWSYRIVQGAPSAFQVQVVASASCDCDELRARLQRKFAERLGEATHTEVEFVDTLPRTPRGKVRTVIASR